MIDTESLRKKVIDLAIRGKLTQQLPEDGNAEDLYARIQEEKAKLVKEGKIKKEKLLPPITEDEIPFEIPENWKWVRIGDVTYNHGQKTPKNRFCYIDVGTLDNVNHKLNEVENVVEAEDAPSRAKKIVELGDVIYSTVRPYLHNICIIDRNFLYEPIASTAFAIMHTFDKCMVNQYLYFWLLSDWFDKYANGDNSKGTLYPAIGENDFFNGLIPMPPYDEQIRITEIIKEVVSISRKIDDLQRQYGSDLVVLKNKIIDAGIRGKLTEQLPEDGNAEDLYAKIQEEKEKLIKEGKIKKEKPLPPIEDDEIPFEIPGNWKWVRLSCISNKITDGTHHSPVNTSSGDYMYITAKNIKPEGVSLDNITYVSSAIHEEIYSRCNPEKNDVLLIKDGATTGVVTVNNLDFQFSLLSSVALIKGSDFVEPWFLAYSMRSSWFSKHIRREMTGVGITRVVLRQIENFVMPLPPYNEQKRIVKAINNVFEQLK